jgi:lysophospholipase L1-like esterase
VAGADATSSTGRNYLSRTAELRLAAKMVAMTLALSLSINASAVARHADAAQALTWVEAWYSPPFPPIAVLAFNDVRAFGHQTVRQVVRLEAGGERLRVRLTNELGLVPVKIGSVHLALSSPNGVTEPETDHALTFGGRPDTVIPVGQAVLSDPVQMKVDAFVNLGISIYYLDRVAPAGHLSRVLISTTGDHGADSSWPGGMLARAPALASGVEVETTPPHRVLVAFGDSITEGAGATPGINMDYPEQLALRLDRTAAGKGWVVINSGIGGNRLLHDGTGPRALDRFDRDVLDIPGVSAILVMEGVNDIGVAFDPEGDSGPLSADGIIGAYQQMIERAHARGLRIFGGTITPYEGAGYFRPEGNTVREAVNAWIRTSHAFDGVVDFDEAVRDPQHPSRYRGAYQSGDCLHPNDAGYRAMSEAVDLSLLR